MKSMAISSAAIFISVVTLFAAQAASAEPQPRADQRTITVNGDAEIKVEPDEIILTLGIETQDKDLARSKDLNDDIAGKLLAALRGLGIDRKHIQTDYLNIEPVYENYARPENFIGYFVRKTFVVTLKDISKFEDVLSASLDAGVNKVQGIQFRTTALRKHRDEARALAVKAAREKAIALAGELGQKIGEPYSISETGSGWYSWYGSAWWGGRGGGMFQNVSQNAGGGSLGDESVIAPGRISVNASVTVVFEMQ